MAGCGDNVSEAEGAGRLTVDLGALAANWRDLAARAAPAETAAVVKADAYGIGIAAVVPALAAAGCRTFFVALPHEACRVRAAAPRATVYVLDDPPPEAYETLASIDARPVLGSLASIEAWSAFCAGRGSRLRAAVHIDTGMNRLGLEAGEAEALASRPELFSAFELALVMSHLACGDSADSPMNRAQAERFECLRRHLPHAPASLANSAGTLLGQPYLLDLARPGIALYGGRAIEGRANPMRPVVRAEARIAQVRRARAGESVGYGATQTLARDSRLAIVSAGYADGYLRAAGSRDGRPGARVFIAGEPAPIVGRVSMDLIAADVTDIPEGRVSAGDYAELLGNRFTVDDLAECAGTIGYEILTSLGRRYARRYSGGES